jgi:hypothetical protein
MLHLSLSGFPDAPRTRPSPLSFLSCSTISARFAVFSVDNEKYALWHAMVTFYSALGR